MWESGLVNLFMIIDTMMPKAKFSHVNDQHSDKLVYQNISEYIQIFSCVPVPVTTDLQGRK